MVVGEDGLIQVSVDGITWKEVTADGYTRVSLQAMASGNGVFVVAGHNLNTFADMVMVSKNGLVWEPVYTGGVAECRWVAYGGGRFLLVGVHGQTASSSTGTTGPGWFGRASPGSPVSRTETAHSSPSPNPTLTVKAPF